MNRLATAAVGRVADTLALANLDAGFRVVGSGGAHALLDLASHGKESLLDIASVLGRSLEEGNAQAVGEFLWTLLASRWRIFMAEGVSCDGTSTRFRNDPIITYLGHGVLDNLLVGHIALVTNKELVHAFGGITVDFLEPLLNIVEGVHVGNIVDDADAMGTTVV